VGGIKAEPDAVVLYARVSTKEEAFAGNLERQLEGLRAYAREKGYRVVAENPAGLPGADKECRRSRKGTNLALQYAGSSFRKFTRPSGLPSGAGVMKTLLLRRCGFSVRA